MSGSFSCTLCGHVIQENTARIHGSLCAQCAKLSPSCVRVRRLVASGLDPYKHTVQLYSAEIQKRSWSVTGGYFGAIGDPVFEGVRLYSFASLDGVFDFARAVEIASDTVDEIGYFLAEVRAEYSLFSPLMAILKSIAPVVNSRGGTVFLGSWGMGPEEIGWSIRYLNERSHFLRYIERCRISENEVDRYDVSYTEALKNEK